MADLDLLTEIHTDVRYIKETLNKHIEKDEKISRDFILPLWETHQQHKGAARFAGLMYSFVGGALTLGIGAVTGIFHK